LRAGVCGVWSPNITPRRSAILRINALHWTSPGVCHSGGRMMPVCAVILP
jgi:hypothetical protein